MKAWNKFLPVFEGEGGTGSAPPAAPIPAEAPAAAPVESVAPPGEAREIETDEMKFVLNAFDPMNSDLNEEEILELPGSQAPVEAVPQSGTPPVQTSPTPPVAVASPTPTPQPQVVPGAPQPSATPTTAPQQTAPTAAVPDGGVEPSKILDQLAEQVAQQQETFTKALAETQYKIDDKDAEALGFLPEQAKSIAALQAKVHVNVVSSMTQMLSKQLPVMVQGLLTARDKSREAEDRFYGTWPQLRGAEKQGTLRQVMATYRQMNPQALEGDFIKTTGAMACAILGIPLQQAGAPAVQAPQVQTPGPIVRQTSGLPAFAPAGTSTAPPGAHPSPQLNEWDRIARIINADDQGAFDR